MSEVIPHQQSAVTQHMYGTDVFGRPRVSKGTLRRVRFEVEEAIVDQVKIERAKAAAVSGMLAEKQVSDLAAALYGSDPEGQLAAADWVKAIRFAGLSQVYKAGS